MHYTETLMDRFRLNGSVKTYRYELRSNETCLLFV